MLILYVQTTYWFFKRICMCVCVHTCPCLLKSPSRYSQFNMFVALNHWDGALLHCAP